jgi:FeS assembly SUF system protein
MGFFSRLTDNENPPADAPSAPSSDDTAAPAISPAAEPPGAWDFGAFVTPAFGELAESTPPGPTDPAITAELEPLIVEALRTVYDPEIPVDIYELGLVYGIAADADRRVRVTMTLTSPACPSAQQIPVEVQYKVKAVQGVSDVTVDVVWEPPWDKDKMSEMAKLTLGMF